MPPTFFQMFTSIPANFQIYCSTNTLPISQNFNCNARLICSKCTDTGGIQNTANDINKFTDYCNLNVDALHCTSHNNSYNKKHGHHVRYTKKNSLQNKTGK